MSDAILVINAGSSSIKFGIFRNGGGEPSLAFRGQMEGIGSDPAFSVKNAAGETIHEHDEWPRGSTLTHLGATRFILDYLRDSADGMRIIGAGHRVVHGGLAYDRPVVVTPEVIETLAELVPLAPLHQPHNLAAIRAIGELDPELPQVACFDTAFHSTQPPVAKMFALPRELTESGIRRYGFHGLSYEYIARRLPAFDKDASRVVVAHLGSGASMCAIKDGKSLESSMGFTAVDGLPMGTRTGALDPGVLLFLMQERRYDAAAIETLLYKQSGLLGVSGISNDMRDLASSNDPRAAEAIELFVYQVGKFLGALTAALGGIDALVFTAGIGENDRRLRARVCEQAAWLGVKLDREANERNGPRISAEGSAVSVWVIPTNEEGMIAMHTLGLVGEANSN